jgi:hypothetical protein
MTTARPPVNLPSKKRPDFAAANDGQARKLGEVVVRAGPEVALLTLGVLARSHKLQGDPDWMPFLALATPPRPPREPVTRSERFSAATAQMRAAKQTCETLRDEYLAWRESIPERLKGGEKPAQVEAAAAEMSAVISALDSALQVEVAFPSAT